ncbi:hypothetical protein HID58_050754 [Brassica napus]|uniref:Major facilitator superfamily (MFS) profile domain-containing protein n=2 Tax=Brassica TaxID=3705 RepID=A0ABQ8A8F4_BRANA|nr:hypothetical protein HID58_050754 [Brassica napus]
MFSAQNKIKKDKNAEPTECDVQVAQALFDLENTNQELKSELKDLYINQAVNMDIAGNRKAIVIYVPFRLRKAFRKIHPRLVRELEKKFSGKDVIFVATRRIMRPPKKGAAVQRPRNRTLTSVHEAMLEDVAYPAEIVGKRTRYRLDGSKVMKVYLEAKERNNTEYKLETMVGVYRKLTGKDVTFEYPFHAPVPTTTRHYGSYKCPSSTYTVKANAAFAFQRRTFSNLLNRSATTTTGSRFSPLNLHLHCSASKAMGAKLARAENGIQTVMNLSSVKARSVRAQASSVGGGGDEEEAVPLRSESNSSGTVLPFVAVACLGAILFGYHLGVVNGALEYLAKDLGIADNTVLQGNALLAGATVGSFTGGTLADKFGRTRTFQLDAIPLAIGAFLWYFLNHQVFGSSVNFLNVLICSATAQSVQTMIVGRLLAGIGIGISSAIVPLYISEISPTEIRGALGSVNQLFICIGILAALIAGLPLAANPLWWRTMFGVAVIPSVLLAIGMGFSPESPRWLVQQGKVSEAEKAIKTLYGKEKVVELVRDLSTSGQGVSEPEAGWFDLFNSRYWKVVSVGAALFLFQQLAGINAVVYYSTSVFRSAGIQSDVAASALVGASNVFGTAVASSLMDKMGRKSLLLISFGGMALSMLLLSLSFTWKALAAYSGTLAVVGTVLYVLSFSLGAGPVPALLLPEIFASRIRAKAVALSLGMHWISNFVIGLYFLSVVTKFGISSVYLGFAAVCVLAVIYIAGNVVETKGRSLEEIELALNSGA